MEENQKNQQDQQQQDTLHEERAQAQGAGSSNSDHNNASAVRGGTTDLDHVTSKNASGIASKSNVTGSDMDGQVTR